ncbi:Phosphatidylglycerol/phosphatidylinositol transfer protein [Blyttiomyces sp. JEL0837]|nr:Phosphatidylglycerol/phosphatidylinositol transfer protein [Blyttiomyces sp. JEL0837]
MYASTIIKSILAIYLSTMAIAAPVAINNQSPVLSGFDVCPNTAAPIDTLALSSLTYSPNPVQAGKPLVITLKGKLSQPIVNGTKVHITATGPFGIKALDSTADLCTQKGIKCPIPAGNQTISFSVDIPSDAPNVTVDVKAVAILPNGKEVVCVENKSFKV